MKFSRLRLSGFKSFVDPTELHIESGLSGVVGPNGCGKSNLLEAIRWVMGESRPTSMRGSGMDDVIFSGSAGRPMRNHAEVTLIIDNSGRTAPSPYNEFDAVEISRRIEREMGSAYRINGREVRQRDVQIFFADASTGAQSPALVRQGQISVLINQKPLQRRAILEEAAGIAGLHQRRHEAELRLKAAEANMMRLDDVIAEVEGQLQGLKRQARQASRYRNLSGHIRKAEALVFLLRWQAAEATDAAAAEALREVSIVVAERTQDAAIASTEQAKVASELPPLRDAEAVKTAALQRLLHERDALQAEETRARDEAQRTRQRIGQAESDVARERTLEQDAETALAGLADETTALEDAGRRATGELSRCEARARELAAALAEKERRLEELTIEFAELTVARENHERTLEAARRQADDAASAFVALQPKLSEMRPTAGDPDVTERAVEAARAALAETAATAEGTRTARTAADAAEASAREARDAALHELQRMKAEADALTRVLREGDAGTWTPLIDSVRVDDGYEAAFAAAMGDSLESSLDETAPHRWRELGPFEAAQLPEGAVALSTFVKAPSALARRLEQTGVVDEGAALVPALKPGQRLVTKRGDLWRWDGYSASADAPTRTALRLEQRNRLVVLQRELDMAKARHAELTAEFATASGTARAALTEFTAAERSEREREAALSEAQASATRAARAAAEHSARFAALEAEARRLKDSQTAARRTAEAADAALNALADSARLSADLEVAREDTAGARAAANEAGVAAETLRKDASRRVERLSAIAADATRWSERRDASRRQMDALTARIAAMHEELTQLEALPATLAGRRAALADMLEAAEAARKATADTRAEAETRLAEADKRAKATNALLTEAREQRAGASARSDAAKGRLAELKTRIRDELDTVPDALFERAELKDGAELPPLEDAEDKVERLKREREQLGGVNLRAEEEAEEYERRLATLQSDRADLSGAIERLRRGIQSLNREGRDRLIESFAKVNTNFERLFKELFQGGEARLTFTESDDPLEAGLEILAKPPGKKLTTLSLLSGGEQALTAIALIFAVFLVNPAPICVLDEVDAPLDDANVDRFCRLLDEMTRLSDTRFLVITHHPLTMSRMDRLFGVTMSERGVSQLVSVSLDEAERVVAAE